jgi:DNA-binding response OmpR family regulator
VGTAKHILVVDDDLTAQTVLKINLELDGYDVACVSDGDAALAHLAAHPVDLVLLDLTMPGMSGAEALSRICDRKSAPVIVVSGLETDEALDSLRLGAADYVIKPISPAALLERVRTVLLRSARPPGDPAPEVPSVSVSADARTVAAVEARHRFGRPNFPDTTVAGWRPRLAADPVSTS